MNDDDPNTFIFVRSLNIEKRKFINSKDVHEYFDYEYMVSVDGGFLYAEGPGREKTANRHAVPIEEFFEFTGEDEQVKRTYIAWSDDVDKVLGHPFSMMRRRAEAAEHSSFLASTALSDLRRKVNDAKFFSRLRYLLTGRGLT